MSRSPLRTAATLAMLMIAIPRVAAVAESGHPMRPAGGTAAAAPSADSLEAASLARLEAATAAAGLATPVLHQALAAHARMTAKGSTSSTLLTVIDFSLASRTPRLWVIDLAADSVLAHELVAHGNGSGGDLATAFSNRHGSHQSSLGTYVTANTYTGKHGRSLRLRGMDAGINDAAFARAIVIHGADYVRADIVPQLGRLGRSQGCPALSREAAPRIIDLIKDGTVVYAYHPSLVTAS